MMKLPIDNWPFIAIGTVLSFVFVLFGVRQLVSSYHTTEPYMFLMLFFSSSMIILINGTIFIILLVLGHKKFYHYGRSEGNQAPTDGDDNDN
jgi:hypothetical protein